MVVWQLTREEGNNYGYARRALRGHSHFVQVGPSSACCFTVSLWQPSYSICFAELTRFRITVLGRKSGWICVLQDVVISSDGQFALSGSWDGTLRLWDLNTGNTTRRFIGHQKDVLSVAFSVDNRQVDYLHRSIPGSACMALTDKRCI